MAKFQSIPTISLAVGEDVRKILIPIKQNLEILTGVRAASSGKKYQTQSDIDDATGNLAATDHTHEEFEEYYTKDELGDGALDERYYQEEEVDILLSAQDEFIELQDVNVDYAVSLGGFLRVRTDTNGVEASGKIKELATGEVQIGDISGGNYVEVETTGHIELIGNATDFDDLRVSMVSTKLGGVKDPGFSLFKDNGSGSTGVFTYFFDSASEEELFFAVQLPHGWKEGSDIAPHVHWVPKTNGGAGDTVSWGLEYTWANYGSDFSDTAIIYTNTHTPSDDPLVAGRHYKSFFADISGAGKTISSMILCRIFRDATSAGLTDDYADDAGLLEIDFHFAMDGIGSREAMIK